MKAKLAILTLALVSFPLAAQAGLKKASADEVLEAAKSNVAGKENKFPVDVSYTQNDVGETLTIYTLSGPGTEFESIVSHCLIKMEETIGYDRDAGLIRAVSTAIPICGDQYKNPVIAEGQAIVEASFAITEIVAH